MGTAGIGNVLSSIGAQYDFTKLTNKQFLTTVQELGSEGKISQTDADQLSNIAQGVDSVPINGPNPTESQILADPTQHNFLAKVEGTDYSVNHTAGSVGGALYDSLVKDLQTYQGTAIQEITRSLSIVA